MSRSSCEAEVKAIDKTAKESLHLCNLMRDLGLKDVNCPRPVYNGNRGALDWSNNASIFKK